LPTCHFEMLLIPTVDNLFMVTDSMKSRRHRIEYQVFFEYIIFHLFCLDFVE